jgi:hypothetical protein
LDPAFLPLNYLTERIKKDFGFKVAITGDGGDELFRGYELFKLRRRINFVSSRGIAPAAHKLIGLMHPLFAGSEKRNSFEFLLMRLDSVLQNSEIPWFETALSPYAGTGIFSIFSEGLNVSPSSRSTKKKILQENALWHTALGIYLLCLLLLWRFASRYLCSVLKVPSISPWTTFSSGQGHPCVDCCKHAILGRLDEEVLGL